ncbi:hypothetical protein TRIUR3_33753 [Triticum urartu]|uniref:Uncharacterized protein n=1 Tax=Triticum urartu TaxID=4572 RepID=M7Z109_TRIUA|nr:hypothetical protein TRIUR3_33753 [Triticum urartu]
MAHLAGDGGAGAAAPWMNLPLGRSRWTSREGQCGRPGRRGGGGGGSRPASAPARKKGMRGEEALGHASFTVAQAWEVPLQCGGERKNSGGCRGELRRWDPVGGCGVRGFQRATTREVGRWCGGVEEDLGERVAILPGGSGAAGWGRGGGRVADLGREVREGGWGSGSGRGWSGIGGGGVGFPLLFVAAGFGSSRTSLPLLYTAP